MRGRWIKDDKIGEIFVEKILLDCGFPILFVSIDIKSSKRYLSLCLEDDEEYLLASCDVQTILDVLCKKRDVFSVFNNAEELIKITYDKGIVWEKCNKKDIGLGELLPTNSFLEANVDINEYIDKLERETQRQTQKITTEKIHQYKTNKINGKNCIKFQRIQAVDEYQGLGIGEPQKYKVDESYQKFFYKRNKSA